MSWNVTILSKETIKPSSPTPSHLRTFKLSLLDQYSPPIACPTIFFYSAQVDPNHFKKEELSAKLKESLSETLTDFYPLAGTLEDNYAICCNDNGIDYLETQVNCSIDQLIASLKLEGEEKLIQLLPLNGLSSGALLQAQVSIFECGGISVATRSSHKIVDGATSSLFVNTWAAKTRGEKSIVRPCFDTAVLFPPRDVLLPQPKPPQYVLPKQRLVTSRFQFHSSKISALKAKSGKYPTRVEVVSAVIWKCLMKTAKSLNKFKVVVAVNIRRKMVPQLPNSSFGNVFTGAISSSTEKGVELDILVDKLRKAIRKIDGDYINDLQYGDGVSKFYDSLKESYELAAEGNLGIYRISSMCGYNFGRTDFGMGSPIWISFLNISHANVVALSDALSGDGIDAFVTLDEESMALLESDQELLEFAVLT